MIFRGCLVKSGQWNKKEPKRRSNRKDSRWGNELMPGCFGSLRSRRKGGLGFRDLAQDKLLWPGALPWWQVSWAPLEFRRWCLWGRGKDRGQGGEKGLGVLLGGRAASFSL